MEWASNLTTANWIGLLQVSLFVFIILLGFPMAFTLLAMSVIFGYYAFFDAKLFAESGVFANRIFDLIVKNAFSTMDNIVGLLHMNSASDKSKKNLSNQP